jgi:hypothetical protein
VNVSYNPSFKARANHTGTQAPASISPQGAASALDADLVDSVAISPSRTTQSVVDQSFTNDTLADVASLTQPVGGNKTYKFKSQILVSTAGAIGGIKVAVNGPAAPVNLRYTARIFNSSTLTYTAMGTKTAYDDTVGVVLPAGDHIVEVEGIFENGGNAGTFAIRAAQFVTDASASIAKKGSALENVLV